MCLFFVWFAWNWFRPFVYISLLFIAFRLKPIYGLLLAAIDVIIWR